MLPSLQKHAPAISILLLLALLVTLFFYPPSSHALSSIIIVFGVGTAIIFTVHGNLEPHKEGKTTRPEFIRNTIIDLLGLALVMGAAMFFGSTSARLSIELVGGYAGNAWGITSTPLSTSLAGIIAGMAVGFGVAFLVQKVWGKVAEPLKV